MPPWHRSPTLTHRSWQAGPKPSSFCPWQGLAASVRLMKPSGCDTISSKLGREPLPVPVREGGRVPINKTILESRRKGLFCSHPPPPPCSPTLYFYKRAGPRPTTFTQRSQLHIVAATLVVLLLAHTPPHAGLLAGWFFPAAPAAQAMSSGLGGQRGRSSQTKLTQTHTYAPHPPMGGTRTTKAL